MKVNLSFPAAFLLTMTWSQYVAAETVNCKGSGMLVLLGTFSPLCV